MFLLEVLQSQVYWVNIIRLITTSNIFWEQHSIMVFFLKNDLEDQVRKIYLNCLLLQLLSNVRLLSVSKPTSQSLFKKTKIHLRNYFFIYFLYTRVIHFEIHNSITILLYSRYKFLSVILILQYYLLFLFPIVMIM